MYLTDSMLVRVVLSMPKYPRPFMGPSISILRSKNFRCCLSDFTEEYSSFSWACLLKYCMFWKASSMAPVCMIRQKIPLATDVKQPVAKSESASKISSFLNKLDNEMKMEKIDQICVKLYDIKKKVSKDSDNSSYNLRQL